MARAGKNHKGGRPKGSKSIMTLEKEAVFASYRQGVLRSVDVLRAAQLGLAKGSQYLFKIEKEKVVGPKGGVTYKSKKPVLVTSPQEMEDYLAGQFEDGDAEDEHDPSAAYYFMTAKDPENQAIKDMLDRIFGKPKEFVELSGDKNNPVVIDTKHATQEQIDAALSKLLGR